MKIIHKHQKYRPEDGESFVLHIEGKMIPVMFTTEGRSCSKCPLEIIRCLSYVQCMTRGSLVKLEDAL